MHNNSIAEWLKKNNIAMVECLVPDMTGNARGKFIPAEKFIADESRLPESILAQAITGEYSDEHWDFMKPNDGDMLLKPDPETIRSVPWAKEPTAQIIHDCFFMDKVPHPLSSRHLLKQVLSLYEQEGWMPVVAPEMEFYLTEKNTNPRDELKPPVGRSGRRETIRQSYGVGAANEFEDFLEAMYRCCNQQNLDIDTLVHESGTAQLEVNFKHGDALKLADQVFTFKRSVREMALQHDMYATFMAKPYQHEPGNAMHIHQSVLDNNGDNIFVHSDGQENDLFRWYIGGMQKYIPYCISFFAPNVNSYRRFTKEASAPVNMDWGYDNRTAGLRIPNGSANSKRVENRFPGADANPYLAMAASLACGYLGIKHKLEPTPPNSGNAYDGDITIQRNLLSALTLLDKSPELTELFGKEFITGYQAVKNQEFEEFNQVVTPWEREYLLLNV
jgi:glutamine synthetase